jgi:histidinol-phosphate aminotransferase
MTVDLKKLVNPIALAANRYNMEHVAISWEHEGKIQRMMANESAYPPLESVQAAIRGVAAKANWYAEDASECLSLRSKLAAYASVHPENITLGNGSMELFDILFHTFLAQPGLDEIIIVAPDYTAYSIRAQVFGAVVRSVTGGEDTDKVADAILRNVTPRTKLVLLSRPNNPTGKVIPHEDVLRLLQAGVPVILDEAYVEFADVGTTMASRIKDYNNLLITRTFSKGFGLAGLRLGYLLADPEMIDYANRVRHALNVNLVAVAAAEASLDDRENLRARLIEQCQTRDWLAQELGRIPGMRPIPSQGNFILVNVLGSGQKVTPLVEEIFARGFYVRDFSSKPGLKPDQYFRITVGQRPCMERFVQVLRDLVE